MKRIDKILIGLIFAVILFNFFSFRPGQNWGGDFAEYVQQARCIVEPEFYKTFIHYQTEWQENAFGEPSAPFLYPWGYPLLLSIPYSILGNNMLGFQLITYFVFIFSFWIVYKLMEERLSKTMALFLVLLFAINPLFTADKNNVMSDMPFCTFMLLALYGIDSFVLKHRYLFNKYWSYFILGVLAFLPVLFRTQGLVMIILLLVIQLLNKPRKKVYELFPYIVFTGVYIIYKIIAPSQSGNYADHFTMNVLGIAIQNLGYYCSLFQTLFFLKTGVFSLIIYLCILPFFIVGIFTLLKKEQLFVIYLLINLGILLVFPYTQGMRFVYHLVPILFYFVIKGMLIVGDFIKWNTFFVKRALLASFFLYMIVMSSGANIYYYFTLKDKVKDGPYLPEAKEMFNQVHDLVADDELVYFYKPRIMTLYSNKLSSNSLSEKILDSDKNWLVIDKEDTIYKENGLYSKWVEIYSAKISCRFENDRFKICKINKYE